MKKIKFVLAPVAAILLTALLSFLFGFIPAQWQPFTFITAVVLGLIPMCIEIAQAAFRKKIDLGIPVVVTIIILLYIKSYWIAGIFMLLIILGKIFKEYILWRVEKSVNEISRSLPDTAFLKNGGINEIKINEIKKNDVLVVKAGGRVPVDGILLTDEASLDESVVTGESRAVSKHKGDHIVAGSINQSDYLEIQATDTSENSTLAQIHTMVKEAQTHSTPLSRFTTRFAAINSIVALAGSVIIYFVTRDIKQSLAFWIALVPVIFAIIVPVATTIGISILAKKGVMVKTGEALENLTRINSIVFDKTGTLTKGTPEINAIIIADKNLDENLFIQITASVEKYSEHPLSRPIIHKAELLHLNFENADNIEVVKGKGIKAICMNKKVLIGSPRFLQEEKIAIDDALQQTAAQKEKEGNTPIFAAINHTLAGAIFMGDQLRPGIKQTMDALKAMNIKLTMLTGDNKAIAETVAHEIGLTRFYAEMLPQDKIKHIRDFKQQGERVVMIGDGINDAPALAESNVGIAMGLRGVDVTLNAAQVALIKDDINALPDTIKISKKVLNVIRLNLFIATAIHVLAAALTVAGVMGILGSAVTHQLSSSIVLLNTLRIFSVGKKR